MANPLSVREARGWVSVGLVRRMVTVAVVGAALFTSAGPAEAQTAGDAEAAFLARVTAARQAQGLAALPVEGDLASVARAHSADMAAVSRLFHNSALAQQVTQWITVGENVGAGSTVDQVHQTLMSSAVHRGDILSTRYDGVGIGVVQSGGTLWVTQVFRQKAGAAAPPPPPPPPPPAPPVTDPPATLPVEITPVTAPPTTAAPAPRVVAAPARSRAATTAPTTTPTTVAPPTTEPSVPEFAPAAAPAPAVVELAGPAAEVNLGPVAPAAVEPIAARPELVAAGLVAVTLLWLVGFKAARLAVARRRPAYLHRAR